MFLMKKAAMAALLLIGVICASTPATATTIDITVSNLGNHNLAAFDLDVSYDADLLTFDSYTLTEELGSFDLFDAEDWSIGDDGFGTVNLSVLSWLFDFSGQNNDFVLATLSFDGDESAMAGINLSYIDLSDEFGDAIPYAVNGTDISVVPEPSAVLLLGAGLLGLAGLRRRNL